MLSKYIDNINVALRTIPRGYGWKDITGLVKGEKVLIWSKEKMEEYEREDKSDSARMFSLIREVGNTLVPGLRLMVNLPEMHRSGKCPMLDL